MWQAFWALSPSRAVGMDVGAIPLSEVVAYFKLTGLADPELREDYARFIRAMDAAFLDWHHQQQKARRR